MRRTAIAFVLAALLVGCGGSDDGGSNEGTGTSGAPASGGSSSSSGGGSSSGGSSAGASGGTTAEAKVTLTGGPDAGRYEESVQDAGCSYGLVGEDSFGLQLSKDTSGFSSLQLIVPSTKEAKGGTKNFLTTVMIGPLLGEHRQYEVETRTSEQASASGITLGNGSGGSGTVKIDDRGSTATIEIDATTADGVKIEADVDCKTVLRF